MNTDSLFTYIFDNCNRDNDNINTTTKTPKLLTQNSSINMFGLNFNYKHKDETLSLYSDKFSINSIEYEKPFLKCNIQELNFPEKEIFTVTHKHSRVNVLKEKEVLRNEKTKKKDNQELLFNEKRETVEHGNLPVFRMNNINISNSINKNPFGSIIRPYVVSNFNQCSPSSNTKYKSLFSKTIDDPLGINGCYYRVLWFPWLLHYFYLIELHLTSYALFFSFQF